MAATVTPEPIVAHAPSPRRARMAHYALWQARDYLFERGLPTVLVGTLAGGVFGALPVRAVAATGIGVSPALIAKTGSVEAARQVLMHDASMSFLRAFMGALVFLGALFAMNGLVSNDRKLGFYRFLFAKPVTPERYYGQAFMVNWAGFLLVTIVLGLLWGAFVVPVLSVKMLVAMMLVYLCYAGIAFMLTAVARWDWLSLVLVSLVATELWNRFGDSPSPFAALLYLLPPLPKSDLVYAAVAQGAALPWQSLLWLAGYGAAAFVAGLAVLRHRRLAIP